jgi:ankyrin repeat protein
MSKGRIIEAAKALDLPALKKLLEAKPALVNVTDRDGRNLLHLVCSASPAKQRVSTAVAARLIDLLLDRGLKIDAPVGRDACTPLFFAVARARNLGMVKHLLKRGAQVTAAPGGGLYAAGWWEDLDILKLLIRAGAPIECVVGVTPFLACWCWKRFAAAKCLAELGANVNVRDAKGRTALWHGVEKELDPALLKWLVKHGASPDIAANDGVTARQKASRKRDKRFVAAMA